MQQLGEGVQARFSAHPPILEELKAKASKLGLWNMFLPKGHFKEGAGFSNLEYGLMAEYLGKSRIASEACNCSAPDTGNMGTSCCPSNKFLVLMSRYRGARALRFARAAAEVARSSLERRDSVRVLHDGAVW